MLSAASSHPSNAAISFIVVQFLGERREPRLPLCLPWFEIVPLFDRRRLGHAGSANPLLHAESVVAESVEVSVAKRRRRVTLTSERRGAPHVLARPVTRIYLALGLMAAEA